MAKATKHPIPKKIWLPLVLVLVPLGVLWAVLSPIVSYIGWLLPFVAVGGGAIFALWYATSALKQTDKFFAILESLFKSDVFKNCMKALLIIGVGAVMLYVGWPQIERFINYLSCDKYPLWDRRWVVILVSFGASSFVVGVLALFTYAGLAPEIVQKYGSLTSLVAFFIIVGLAISWFQMPNKFFNRYTGAPEVAVSADGQRLYYCVTYDEKKNLVTTRDQETGELLRKPTKADIAKFKKHPEETIKKALVPFSEIAGVIGNYWKSAIIVQKKDSEKALKDAEAYDPYAPKKEKEPVVEIPKQEKKEITINLPSFKKSPKREISSERELRIVSPSEDVTLTPGKISFCWEGENIGSRELVDLQFALPGPDGGYDPFTGFRFCNGWNFSRDCGFCTIPESATGKTVKVFAGVRPKTGRYQVLDYKYYPVK